MANISEKAISILAGNLNSGLSYLITTVHLPSISRLQERTSRHKEGLNCEPFYISFNFFLGTPTKQEPEPDKASSFSKELARLQFFGAGPKLAGVPTEKQTRDKTRGVKLNFEYDPVSYKEFCYPIMFSLQFRAF